MPDVDLSSYEPGSFDVTVTRHVSNQGSGTLTNAFSLLPHGPDRLITRGAWGAPINQTVLATHKTHGSVYGVRVIEN